MLDTCTITSLIRTVGDVSADGLAVVEVIGDLDIANADLGTVLTTALGRGPAGLMVDLTRCTFFCSTGITALYAAAVRARELEVPMVVVADHHAVCRPLRITGMDEVLTLVANEGVALATLRSGRPPVDRSGRAAG